MVVSVKQLGVQVAAARAKAGLTQAELAQRANLDTALLAAIEQGEHKTTSVELARLAEALGVDELELMRRPAPGYLII
jgi:transcriptional regulator with XRE-family HTH domain